MNLSRTITLVMSLSLSILAIQGEITARDRFLIDELKKTVLPYLPPNSPITEFKNDDLYWMKWLNENSFNLNKTRNHFFTNLKWRQQEKIDTIHLEDWTYFQHEYPVFFGTVDKTGRPLIEIWFSDWNMRQAVISGKTRLLVRWLIYNLEMGMRTLFTLRAENNSTATGITEILDYLGVSTGTLTCTSCLPIYDAMQSAGPQHYPGIVEEVIMVNVALQQRLMLTAWQTAFSSLSSNKVQLFGNENEWGPILHRKIDKDQLSIRFGGSKTRA